MSLPPPGPPLSFPSHEPRIFIVKPSSLGDIIHTLPALSALRAAFPEASLGWIVNTEWAPLLLGHPHLDEVVAFPRQEFRGLTGWWNAWQWMQSTLSDKEPDLVLDFQGLARSAVLARSTKAPIIAGFREARELAWLAYHRRIPVPDHRQLHAVHRYLRLLTGLGIPVPEEPQFVLGAGDPVPEEALPAGTAPLVAIHPFSRGAGKSLQPSEVLAFCKEAVSEGLRVVVVGSSREDFDVTVLPEGAVSLLGRTTLPQLIHVLRQACWTLSVDSGPMHLAAALTDRVISLHTWSDPLLVGPCRPRSWIWRDGQLVQVRHLRPGQFPEQRHLRANWPVGAPLLPGGEPEKLARFILSKIR